MFCPVYKGRRFALRPVEEIKADIRAARAIADEIRELSMRLGFGGAVTDAVAGAVMAAPEFSSSYRSVAAWLYYRTGACFLQDADNLIMRTDELVEALSFLRRTFPEIRRVTTYSRSRTVAGKPPEALGRIRAAGLDRVHIGLESGSDAVLKIMKKGVTAEQQVAAGRRLVAAGMEVSEYVMPGLGGQDLWREHAVETARVLNRINPHFIRLRSLRVPSRVPLHELVAAGSFRMQTDDMLAEEIRLFIESLEGITSTVASDHIMNLLEEVSGKLPEDKPRMLAAVEAYQELTDTDRLIFRIGRRGGAFRSVGDLKRHPKTVRKIRTLIDEVRSREGPAGVERMIADMVDQYI
jgi:radical SAM superfamily enzyme YgiQ (UPF0313 family)